MADEDGPSRALMSLLRPLCSDAWVQCDSCALWRRVPKEVSERLGDDDQWCARELAIARARALFHTYKRKQIGLGVCFLAIFCPNIEWQALGGWGRFDRQNRDGLLEFSSGHAGALLPPLQSTCSSLYRAPGGILLGLFLSGLVV